MTNTRDSDLDRIRETYAAYDRDGRDRLWDRTNAGYDRLKSDVETRLLDLIRVSLPDADAAILDVGCGDGDLAVLSRAAGITAPWTGLDLLPSRIESAAKREPDARFVVGSADAMPFDDKVFQVVCAITLFSSLPSPSLESAVATRSGGSCSPADGWSGTTCATTIRATLRSMASRRRACASCSRAGSSSFIRSRWCHRSPAD